MMRDRPFAPPATAAVSRKIKILEALKCCLPNIYKLCCCMNKALVEKVFGPNAADAGEKMTDEIAEPVIGGLTSLISNQQAELAPEAITHLKISQEADVVNHATNLIILGVASAARAATAVILPKTNKVVADNLITVASTSLNVAVNNSIVQVELVAAAIADAEENIKQAQDELAESIKDKVATVIKFEEDEKHAIINKQNEIAKVISTSNPGHAVLISIENVSQQLEKVADIAKPLTAPITNIKHQIIALEDQARVKISHIIGHISGFMGHSKL